MAASKNTKQAPAAPAHMKRVESPFGDSGDGWYQYDLEEKPEDLPPWEGTYLGSFIMEVSAKGRGKEDRTVHKFRLSKPCEALAAKGKENEGDLVTLEPGKILLAFGKWELDEKLKGKIGAEVWVKPLEGKDIGNKNPMWQFDVYCGDIPPQPAATAPSRRQNSAEFNPNELEGTSPPIT